VVSRRSRKVAAPFVVPRTAGARVRTRLRVSVEDAVTLRAVGLHLGSLASLDLAARCAEGRLDTKGKAISRRERKRTLTARSSSRWAGTITRVSEDQWVLAERNLRAEAASLRARARKIEGRLAVLAGGHHERAPGYATAAERHSKLQRLQKLRARIAEAEQRIAGGRVSVCRGGRDLLRKRNNLAAAGLSAAQWREQWDAARMFLTADGEAEAPLGNWTILWNPADQSLELKLPAPLSALANTAHGRYRLSCPVDFTYRGGEVAAQTATRAVRYDIEFDAARGRWYLDASWQISPQPTPTLEDLRGKRLLAVDLNHDHLAAWTLTPDGNPTGPPVTVPFPLAGLPSAQRDGRLRAAVSELLRVAREGGCAAVAVEDLSFTDARQLGRERQSNRPSRGKRGRRYRRMLAGFPTGKFRNRLAQMASNAGLAVIAVDPAYTSRWGAEHWLAPLREKDTVTTGHHAAAVVIGRRAQGYRARRREGMTSGGQRTARRRAAPTAPKAPTANRNGRPRKAQRQSPRWRKTAKADRARPPNQVTQDRSGPPAEHPPTLSVQERSACCST